MAYPPTPPDQTDRIRKLLGSGHRSRVPHPTPPPPPHIGGPAPVAAPHPAATSPYIKGMGSWNMAGAAQAVNEQIDPILQNIANQYNQQALDTANSIQGATNAYADQLSGVQAQTHAMYGGPIKTLTNTAEGVKGSLNQLGQQVGAGLANTLAQGGLPAGAQGPDINPQATGAGSSEAAYQLGQAEINALRQAGAAAEEYASKLPGFAQQQGGYENSIAQQAIAKAMAKDLADAAAQAPTRYYQIYQDLQARDEQQRQDEQSARDTAAKTAAATAAANQKAAATADDLSYKRASQIASSRNRYSDHYYEVRPTNNGYQVVDLGPKSKAAGGKPKQPTNTGPYFHDPTDGKWKLKPGYEPGPNGSVVKTKTPSKTTNPKMTNTGPYYHNPKTGGWELKPGYEVGPNGKVIKTPTASGTTTTKAGGKPVYGSAPHKRNDGVWVTRSGKPLTPAQVKVWDDYLARGITDGAGHITKPTRKQAAGGTTSTGSGGNKPAGLN